MLALQFKSILFGEPHYVRHLNAVTNIINRNGNTLPFPYFAKRRTSFCIYKFNFSPDSLEILVYASKCYFV